MKTVRFAAVVMFALVFFAGLAAQAQTAERPIRAEVPFAFQVNSVQFPAGTYAVYGSADRLQVVNVETG